MLSDCWSLGFQSAAFKAKDSGTFKVWSSLIEQTCKEFKLPELSLESLIELAREGRKVKMKAALESHVPSVLLAADQYYKEKIAPYGGKGGKTLSKDGKRDAQQAKKYLTEAWPWKKVNAVTHQMADTYLKTARRLDGKPLSQQSRRTRLTQFKMFFKWCMSPKRKWITENPCDGLSFTVDRGEVQTLGKRQMLHGCSTLLGMIPIPVAVDYVAEITLCPGLYFRCLLGLDLGLKPPRCIGRILTGI